ncbi:siderophore iron transporter [Sporothrix schenckii 1099-18]|uniref:Siderophore iron transporter n=1 Tax=Sporothrix schenckii 1099-18 TaxID=1397361 RepID=A0A0F2M631_SPOSC|nr:siderophore iron transporter [Sporothrix schenckii 1099-18]KJR83641.1 siderophore iron transporter [Sporothrix schenckii 1099-18]
MEEVAAAGSEKVPSETPSHREDAVVVDVECDSGADSENAAGHMTTQSYISIAALLFTYNAYLYTQLMPPAVLAYINADLGPDANYIWITISWNLAAAVVVTVSGRLADIFGRRWFMISGAFISTIGAIVGATSHTINGMIASGVLFGLGGGIQEMVFSCLQEMVPNNRRFLALGIYEFGNLPAMFGPIIAYAWIAYVGTGWRTCYYWCIAWEGVAVFAVFFFYHPPTFQTKHRGDHETWLHLLAELDYVGLVAFTAGCVLLLLAISWGGVLHPWKSAIVIAPIVVSGVLFVFLGFWEAYAPLKHPILPPRLFRKTREFTTVLVVIFVAGMLYYSNLALWPRVSSLLFIPANDTIKRGIYAEITSFSTTLSAFYGITVMPWLGRERWQLTTLTVLQTTFIGAMSGLSLDSKARTIVFTLLAGSASTCTSMLTFGTISLFLDDQADIGVAVGLTSTSRLIGGAIAGAIYTSIYTNKYSTGIPVVLQEYADAAYFNGSFPLLLKASAINTSAAYANVPGITDAVIAAAEMAVKVAYINAFKYVYWSALAFGGVSICCALATRTVPDDRKTKQRAVTMENEKGIHGTAERAAT